MWDDEESGVYDTAQICLNGHHITGSFHRSPQFRKDRCSECGESTITNCPHCEKEIQGTYHGGNVISLRDTVHDFCHSCGKAYPWLERKVDGLRACIDEMGDLKEAERDSLKSVAFDLVVDTPKTQAAALRYKNSLEKIASKSAQSKAGAQMVAKFIESISSMAVKEALKHLSL